MLESGVFFIVNQRDGDCSKMEIAGKERIKRFCVQERLFYFPGCFLENNVHVLMDRFNLINFNSII